MPLSSDKLTGHPTEQDPNPGARARRIRAYNGWPGTNAGKPQQVTKKTPDEQRRRIELAAKNKARAIRRRRNLEMLKIYAIPEPIQVPGAEKADRLFSRWLKEKGDKRTHFSDLDSFCVYILENYGDVEKDAQWQAYLAEAEPEPDHEELAAQATADAIDRVETQRPKKIAPIPTAALPPDPPLPDAVNPY